MGIRQSRVGRSGTYGVERYTIASRLDPETGWNDRVFWDDDQAIADEVIVCVVVRRFSFRGDYDSIGNACVLVDNGPVDHAIAPDSDWRLTRLPVPTLLEIICPHHNAVSDRGAALNNAAYSNDAAFQVSIRNDASVRDDRLPERGSIDFAARQKAGMGVNRRLGIEETVFRHQIGQIEICFIRGPNRADSFRVGLVDKGADTPIVDWMWKCMLSDVGRL